MTIKKQTLKEIATECAFLSLRLGDNRAITRINEQYNLDINANDVVSKITSLKDVLIQDENILIDTNFIPNRDIIIVKHSKEDVLVAQKEAIRRTEKFDYRKNIAGHIQSILDENKFALCINLACPFPKLKRNFNITATDGDCGTDFILFGKLSLNNKSRHERRSDLLLEINYIDKLSDIIVFSTFSCKDRCGTEGCICKQLEPDNNIKFN